MQFFCKSFVMLCAKDHIWSRYEKRESLYNVDRDDVKYIAFRLVNWIQVAYDDTVLNITCMVDLSRCPTYWQAHEHIYS